MDSVSAEADAGGARGRGGAPSEQPPPQSASNAGLRVLVPVAAILVAVDQLTKIWAVEELSGGRRIDLFWTARFNLVRNEGAAFSLGTRFTLVIAIASIVVAIAVVVFARRVSQRAVLVALGLVLGGAVGNLIDRVFREGDGFLRGAVVDFIDFQWWPVFNVADMGIVIGGLLLVFLLSEPRHRDTRHA